MAERTRYQEGVIKRYYEHRDQILLSRLSELVSELYLEDKERQLDRLWKRIAGALESLKVPADLATHILQKRDSELLARHVKTWLTQSPASNKTNKKN